MVTETDTNPKTDASIATDKVTTVTTDTSTTSMKPVRAEDDRSVEALELLERDEEHFPIPDIPDFTPPLRVTASKIGLAGSFSTLDIPRSKTAHVGSFSTLDIPRRIEKDTDLFPRKLRRRKSDPPSQRSGSRSPAYDGGSSISSLEEMGIDTDFLTDKMGMLELDLKEQQEQTERLNKSLSNLPIVSERLSEETLDDVHAFTELKREEGYASRGNSIATGGEVSSNVLEPLDEGDEEEEEGPKGNVKITNMEEILEAPDEDAPEPSSAPPSR